MEEHSIKKEMHETFNGFIEAIEQDKIVLRTISKEGETATAWLPKSNIPSTELSKIRVGAPIFVKIFKQDQKISWEIYILPFEEEPSQDEKIAADLFHQMEQILKGKS